METRTLSGPVMPDEESAKAAMKGIIDGLGKDGNFEIVSLEASEADGGGWIAVLIVHMLDPEPEEGEAQGESESSGNREQMPAEDKSYYMMLGGHLGKNEVPEVLEAFPDLEEELPVGVEPPETPDIMAEAERDMRDEYASAPPRDEIADAASESVESLTEEFYEAEQGDTDEGGSALDYMIAQRIEAERNDSLTEEDLRILQRERERLDLAAEMAHHAHDRPAPEPA